MSCFVCTANDFTRGFDDYFLNSLSFSSLLGLLFFRFYTFLVDFFFRKFALFDISGYE